ncbi:hypothetical protein [Mesorhizobium sp. B2-8-9]|uniref:SH3 domain-containing protein n=1 Tax=Mesorhizobium sp. B2-8-9 TaxID=2589899 RepID=UPI00112B8058|nr:hypothetical protein [Mesorhizobium sp. B2-8-9]TPI72579.1 hypothetical protein FJ423_27355 [Mesorhizobium sp. B2-8-9]
MTSGSIFQMNTDKTYPRSKRLLVQRQSPAHGTWSSTTSSSPLVNELGWNSGGKQPLLDSWPRPQTSRIRQLTQSVEPNCDKLFLAVDSLPGFGPRGCERAGAARYVVREAVMMKGRTWHGYREGALDRLLRQTATLNGCLQNSKWCTIAEAGGQGWVYSDYVTAEFGGNRVVVTERPANSGTAVVKAPREQANAGAVAGGATGAIAGAIVGGPGGAAVGGAAGIVGGGAAGTVITRMNS